MAEGDQILSQNEVDALLSAIDSGALEVAATPAEGGPQAVPYDFKRPERLGRDQIRAIEALYEGFARGFQGTLAGVLRTIVEIHVVKVSQMTFTEVTSALPSPAVAAVLTCQPLPGHFVMTIQPGLAFSMVERLQGSAKMGEETPDRPLTRIEWNLIDTLLERGLHELRKAWAPVVGIDFRVAARHTNPQLLHVLGHNEATVCVTMEATIGGHKGTLDVFWPVMSLAAHMSDLLSLQGKAAIGERTAQGRIDISRRLAPAEVSMALHLTPDILRWESLRGLQPGDILVTNHPESEPLVVSIEGRPKFRAEYGSLRGHKAMKVAGPVEPDREEPLVQPRGPLSVRRREAPAEGPSGAAGVEGLMRMPLAVAVVVAEKAMPIWSVLGIQPGDVLDFGTSSDAALEMRVGSRCLAEGVPVKIGGNFGLQISSIRPPRDTVAALGP